MKLSFLPEFTKNYAGIFILKMQFPMFYQVGLKKVKLEILI